MDKILSCAGKCPVIVNDDIYQKKGVRACCRNLYRNTNRCDLHQRGSYSVVDVSDLKNQTISVGQKINYLNVARAYEQQQLEKEKLTQTESKLNILESEYQELQQLSGKLGTAQAQLLQDLTSSKREKALLQNEINQTKNQLENAKDRIKFEKNTLQNQIGELRKKLTESNLQCDEKLKQQEAEFDKFREQFKENELRKIRNVANQKNEEIEQLQQIAAQVRNELANCQQENQECSKDFDEVNGLFIQCQNVLGSYVEIWPEQQYRIAKNNAKILEATFQKKLSETDYENIVTDIIGNKFYQYVLEGKTFWVMEDKLTGLALVSKSGAKDRVIYGRVGEDDEKNVQNVFVKTFMINDAGLQEPVQLYTGAYVHPFFLQSDGKLTMGYIALKDADGDFLRLPDGTPIFVDSAGQYYTNSTFTMLVALIERGEIVDGIENIDFTQSTFLPLFLYKAINSTLNQTEVNALKNLTIQDVNKMQQGQFGQLFLSGPSSQQRMITSEDVVEPSGRKRRRT